MISLVALLASLLLVVPSAAARAKRGCKIKGATYIERTGPTKILARPYEHQGRKVRRYWACWKKSRPIRLDGRVRNSRFRARHAQFLARAGRYVLSAPAPVGFSAVLYLLDASTGRRTVFRSYQQSGSTSVKMQIVLRNDGQFAWLISDGRFQYKDPPNTFGGTERLLIAYGPDPKARVHQIDMGNLDHLAVSDDRRWLFWHRKDHYRDDAGAPQTAPLYWRPKSGEPQEPIPECPPEGCYDPAAGPAP